MGKCASWCASWYIEYGLTSGTIILNTIASDAIKLDGWDWKLKNFQLSISTIELKKVLKKSVKRVRKLKLKNKMVKINVRWISGIVP